MKKLTCSLIAIAFATTAVQAQDAGTHADHTAPQATSPDAALPDAPAQDAMPATPDAVPPAADTGVTADADATADTTTTAPAPDATTAGAAVTDAEVESYAAAAAKVQDIATDAALDDAAKQQQMAAAVTASGLAPSRFNEISTALSADIELRTRVQTAMAAQAPRSDS